MANYAASNPCRLKVELLHFYKCVPTELMSFVVAPLLIGGIIIATDKVPFPYFVAPAISVAVAIALLRFPFWLFQSGNVCPAIVIDAEQQLIAVFTDLTKGDDSYPAVFVTSAPLKKMTGGPFQRGNKICFATGYLGGNSDSWEQIKGYPINCGTTSSKQIENRLKTLSDEDWLEAEQVIANLSKPYKKGLIRL